MLGRRQVIAGQDDLIVGSATELRTTVLSEDDRYRRETVRL
jgi:hypothetical protein